MPPPDPRRAAIERLRAEPLDILVLGGGINGAGVARDLALRARRAGVTLRIGLVEQRQFASGTSSRNSQLIHGGLRYLEHLEFRLVREALRERATLIRLAPTLVRPLPFLMPVSGWTKRFYYGAGLVLYDALAGRASLGRHGAVDAPELRRLESGLAADFPRALRFFDAHVHSARFVLANIADAVANGVVAANHVRAEGRSKSAGEWRVELLDTLDGERFEVRARRLVDTTGPWSGTPGLRLVRGSHIVVPRANASENAIAWFGATGRIVFVIPWGERGDLSLVGTTDVDHSGGPDDVRISKDELAYLVGAVKTLFPRAQTEPVAAFSSLRPLVRDESTSPSATSREHRIYEDAEGIVRVSGGKYTTYRVMSEEAADLAVRGVAQELARVRATAGAPLEFAAWPAEGVVEHAVEHDMARRLADVLFVSTYRGWERRWDRESLRPCAERMARVLGWDKRREEEEIEAVLCALWFPGGE